MIVEDQRNKTLCKLRNFLLNYQADVLNHIFWVLFILVVKQEELYLWKYLLHKWFLICWLNDIVKDKLGHEWIIVICFDFMNAEMIYCEEDCIKSFLHERIKLNEEREVISFNLWRNRLNDRWNVFFGVLELQLLFDMFRGIDGEVRDETLNDIKVTIFVLGICVFRKSCDAKLKDSGYPFEL